MTREGKKGPSRSLAIYGLLLGLYPRAYLRRHREELLQNFQDLEREFASKAALWRLIAKDLIVSLRTEHFRTLWGQTAIRFAILSLMLAAASRYRGVRADAAWIFCCGYALGWFAGWFGRRWRTQSSSESRGFIRSFSGQAAMLAGVVTGVLAAAKLFTDLQETLALAFCYAAALAWLSGWWANYRGSYRGCGPLL